MPVCRKGGAASAARGATPADGGGAADIVGGGGAAAAGPPPRPAGGNALGRPPHDPKLEIKTFHVSNGLKVCGLQCHSVGLCVYVSISVLHASQGQKNGQQKNPVYVSSIERKYCIVHIAFCLPSLVKGRCCRRVQLQSLTMHFWGASEMHPRKH